MFFLPLGLQAGPGDHDSPKLFIGGGGATAGLQKEYFTKLAGPDARLMVIPSPGGTPDIDAIQNKWRAHGFTKVSVLHTADLDEAKTPRFAEPLRFADAVWIDGGVQQDYARFYAGTAVEAQLIELLDRGGAIGGSSAGASVQTKAMIHGGTEHPTVSPGFDLLQGAIVDQHFLKRNRLSRLIDAIREHTNLVGYGIDENTALVVDGGKMRVVGKSYVIRIRIINGKQQIDAFKEGDILLLPVDE